eukprot:4352253-Amphidinium_carterae.1
MTRIQPACSFPDARMSELHPSSVLHDKFESRDFQSGVCCVLTYGESQVITPSECGWWWEQDKVLFPQHSD